jgi:hypothetical protein
MSGVGVFVTGTGVLVAGTLVLVGGAEVAVAGGGVTVSAAGVEAGGLEVGASPDGTSVGDASDVCDATAVAVDVAAGPLAAMEVAVADGACVGRPVTVDEAVITDAPGVGDAIRLRVGRRRTAVAPSVSPLAFSCGETSRATEPSEDGANA